MQDMAHFMHGSGDVAGALRADAARLFGSIDALEGRKGQMPLAEFRDTATRLRADLEARLGIKLPELSMGMSGDFAAAVAEGATLVRIGTDIFGPRPSKVPA